VNFCGDPGEFFLFCVVFQYVQNVATNLVYYLHEPGEPLRELGYELLPALEESDKQLVSEIVFYILMAIIVCFALSPFFSKPQREEEQRYVVVMAVRYARVLILVQLVRVVSFLLTFLPSSSFHCRVEADAYDPPESAAEIFLRFDGVTGCGDVMISSHTIFVTLGGLLVSHYSNDRYLKGVVWALVLALGFLVVDARKHYSVDVFIAWYTCPVLWYYCAKTFKDDVPNQTSSFSFMKEQSRQEDDGKVEASMDTFTVKESV